MQDKGYSVLAQSRNSNGLRTPRLPRLICNLVLVLCCGCDRRAGTERLLHNPG
jgi:hypothetical protein